MGDSIYIQFLDPLAEEVLVASETVVISELENIEGTSLTEDSILVFAEFEDPSEESPYEEGILDL